MNFAAMILPERIVAALGWTLFHALWQGALAALGFAVVLYFTRRTSARLRYGLGLAALALTLLLSLVTFWNHTAAAGTVAAAPTIAAAAPAAPTATAMALPRDEPAPAQRLAAFFSGYFSRHLPLLVTLWLLGVLFLTLRFTGGMLYLQRLKYSQSRPLPELWQERLQRLAARAGLRRPLRLLESLRLATPVVVGHLKPVLLLPVGLVTGLAAGEVEALLAHELAHVMRRDYLVNVAQNLVEILYFFHPGVRWISACVRQEREHCCDDFAVELCGDAQHYARALARLQVSAAGFAEPALAAVGRPRLLLRRITRLLAGPRLAHDFREGFLSALLLVVGLFGMLKLAATAAPPVAETKPKAAPEAKAQAAKRIARVSFVLEVDGPVRLAGEFGAQAGGSPGTWLVDESDGQVVWYMDLSAQARKGGGFSEEVPLGHGAYSWYRPAGWKATASWKGKDGKGAWEPLTMFIGGRDRDPVRRLDQEVRLQNEKLLQQMEELRRQEEELRALGGAENERKLQELQKLEQELKARADAQRLAKEKELQEFELQMQMKELERREFEAQRQLKQKEMQARLEGQAQLAKAQQELREQERLLKVEEARLQAEEKAIRRFIAEFYSAGLLQKGKSYRINLSATSLLINGKPQSAASLAKFSKLYESLFKRKLDPETPITIVEDGEF